MTGIPKRKRVYTDESGNLTALQLLSGSPQSYLVASSGTINANGNVIISGTQFKSDSIAHLTYKLDIPESAPTIILHGTVNEGTLSVEGDASAGFYYTLINKTL